MGRATQDAGEDIDGDPGQQQGAATEAVGHRAVGQQREAEEDEEKDQGQIDGGKVRTPGGLQHGQGRQIHIRGYGRECGQQGKKQ